MIKDNITLRDVAGYATERMVWQMMHDLSENPGHWRLNGVAPKRITVEGYSFQLKPEIVSGIEPCLPFLAPETSPKQAEGSSEVSEAWALGALAFYAVTGMNVFEGKGGKTQTEKTEVPQLSSAHASRKLSSLIRQCLSYLPENRPTMTEIHQAAKDALAEKVTPRKKLVGHEGRSYTKSLVKFWPEEMVPVIVMMLCLFFPLQLPAQSPSDFAKSSVPEEMARLVLRCIDLRAPQNAEKVSKALDRDMSWTMMDELAIDKKGECTTTDMVDTFGLNDVGFRLLKHHGGVTNAGGRFRDGRDPRYKYSFIEITVKKNSEVNYQISGREGTQMFAIVPFEKGAQFKASIPGGESFTDTDNGVCYILLRQRIKKNDAFKLNLKNESGKNMAFALINYNSRDHE